MNCPASLLIILKKQWSMQMNKSIGKSGAWGDVEIYIGGRKIEFASSEISIQYSEKRNILMDNKTYSYTGTVSLSKKSLRQFRKIYMIRKVRLPRKLKKKIKKTIW
jgi:hypothetical protein